MEVEMRGAARRIQSERQLVWFGAMLPHLKKKISLQEFTEDMPDDRDRVRRFHEAWDKVDRALVGRAAARGRGGPHAA